LAVEYVPEIARTGGHYNAAFIFATQLVSDLMGRGGVYGPGRIIIESCSTKIVLKQDQAASQVLKEAFNLSEGEEKFIVNAKVGQGILVTQEGRIRFYNLQMVGPRANPMKKIGRAFRWLFGSKYGKLIPILVLSAMMMTVSATVFAAYYIQNTGTVRGADVTLVTGPDVSGSCSAYPCVTSTLSSTNDYATVSFSVFKSVTNSPQPNTYYTNLLQVHNGGSGSHSVITVEVTGPITSTRVADFGEIDVFYCITQTDAPTSSNCVEQAITSTASTGVLSGSFTFPQTIAAGANQYIEIIGHAGSGGTVVSGDTITFSIQVNWV